jgi:DNA gyrase subunit A
MGLRAITLNDGDEIVAVLFGDAPKIGILSAAGNFLMIETGDINAIGRTARGVHAIKLADDDTVTAARIIPSSTTYIASISGEGLFKRTSISEFTTQSKYTKGSKLQKLTTGDWMADFCPITNESTITVVSNRSSIKVSITDLPLLSKGAQGNKSIKLSVTDNIVKILAN